MSVRTIQLLAIKLYKYHAIKEPSNRRRTTAERLFRNGLELFQPKTQFYGSTVELHGKFYAVRIERTCAYVNGDYIA